MENSHLESSLTTTYFEKCSRGMTFLRVNRRPLFQKCNTVKPVLSGPLNGQPLLSGHL